MFKALEEYFKKMIPGLTAEQMSCIQSKAAIRKLRRKQMLLHEGEVCRYKIFVVKGLLRNYTIAENGYEYIVRFTDACGWTTDPESYYSNMPSKYNIDAIEPSEINLFLREDYDSLRQIIPALNVFSENIVTTNMAIIQNRVLLNISASAEEKYMDFINSYPNIFHRVPLHMVASYLGVSRETLTRVRQNLLVH